MPRREDAKGLCFLKKYTILHRLYDASMLTFWRTWRPLWRRWMERVERLGLRDATEHRLFHIVSCQRNAGEAAVQCLQSVYDQDYPKDRIRHVFVDDDSTDNTPELVDNWLSEHPDHSVVYIKTKQRRGGCANTLSGFRMAHPGEIVAELNGDDWLPDSEVLPFLNRVYEDSAVWLTYNSTCFPDGRMRLNCIRLADRIGRGMQLRRRERALLRWPISCMHTFRAELFSHLPEEKLLDPETGAHWANADDVAIHLSLCELAGRHIRHIYRYTYVQNIREYSEVNVDGAGQSNRSRRIVQQKPLSALQRLDMGKEQALGPGKESA